MPIYEFRCAKCGNVQEVLIRGSDSEVEMKCESCSGEVLERVLSRVSYSMSSDKGAAPSVSTKTCGSNTCGTIDVPGPSR